MLSVPEAGILKKYMEKDAFTYTLSFLGGHVRKKRSHYVYEIFNTKISKICKLN